MNSENYKASDFTLSSKTDKAGVTTLLITRLINDKKIKIVADRVMINESDKTDAEILALFMAMAAGNITAEDMVLERFDMAEYFFGPME